MSSCHHHCHGCPAHVSRRVFLGSAAAGAAALATSVGACVETAGDARPRVAVFLLSDPKPVENWPWPGWNPEPRAKEIAEALTRG